MDFHTNNEEISKKEIIITQQTTTTTTTTTKIIDDVNNIRGENIRDYDDNNHNKNDSDFPPYLYVLSDNAGYVGTYYSISDIEEITSSYNLVPFVVQCFKTSKYSDLFTVWVVLYKDIDAVAFVSNNRNDAIKVQNILLNLNITYSDDIDYWKQTIGLSAQAKERLDLLHSIRDKKILDNAYDVFIKKLDISTEENFLENGPIRKLLNEHQKITIMDAIVPSLIYNLQLYNDDINVADIGAANGTVTEAANEAVIKDNVEAANVAANVAANEAVIEAITEAVTEAVIEDNVEAANEAVNEAVIEDNVEAANEVANEDTNEVANKNNISFCGKCQSMVDNYCITVPRNDFLIPIIGKLCYHCIRSIRFEWKKEINKKIQKIINLPINSPNINIKCNTTNVDKLDEVMKNLDELIKAPNELIKDPNELIKDPNELIKDPNE
jgi:hypothetical protein